MDKAAGGRRWLVTGASRGIGRAIAERALAGGDRVCLVARTAAGDGLTRAWAGQALPVACDITDPDQVAAACNSVRDQWGGLDIVVNCAGLHRGGRATSLPLADWRATLDANLGVPFNMVRAALPMMGEGGSIVNIGAVVGFRGFPGDAAYGASKAGLAGLTQVLAAELARSGIRVNLVIPGFVSTEMTAGISDKARRRLVEKIPLGREGTVQEIADVVWWVAGSTYMTGSVIATDGGLMCAL
jgi:3-oxoacyl-[acyl-carrier protein] reductase